MPSRILAMTVVTAAVIVSFLGCDGGEPQFDPATKYSIGSLAQEFALRYKSLDRSKSGLVGEQTDGVPTKSGAVTKKGAVAKAAPANTLDALLGDVIAKAGSIPGLSHSSACRKVAEEVAKDATFSEADQKIIADKLGQVTD